MPQGPSIIEGPCCRLVYIFRATRLRITWRAGLMVNWPLYFTEWCIWKLRSHSNTELDCNLRASSIVLFSECFLYTWYRWILLLAVALTAHQVRRCQLRVLVDSHNPSRPQACLRRRQCVEDLTDTTHCTSRGIKTVENWIGAASHGACELPPLRRYTEAHVLPRHNLPEPYVYLQRVCRFGQQPVADEIST